MVEHYKNLSLVDIVYWCRFDSEFKIERWKDVVGYENIYQISDLGRVKSLDRVVKWKNSKKIVKGIIRKQSLNGEGYLNTSFGLNNKSKSKRIHVLVAEAFLNHKPDGTHKVVVNHKDFNKLNNQSNNLELTTQRENANLKHIKSSSKYTGVGWNKKANKWRARIFINGAEKHLGLFKNEYDAHLAYQKELKEINPTI